MAGAQISTSVTIISSLLGFQAISLTSPAASSLSLIAAGSKVEIAGAFFNFPSNETPNASSWTAVGTSTTGYLTVIPTGAAGSQTVSASWIGSAPTWSDSKQGFYASAASLSRCVAAAFKKSNTSQIQKQVMPRYPTVLNGELLPIFYWRGAIGEWNMDTTVTKTVPFSTNSGGDDSILSIEAWVRIDTSETWFPLTRCTYSFAGTSMSGTLSYTGGGGGSISLQRVAGGRFTGSSWDGTAGTLANRGWVNVIYTVGQTRPT